MKESSSHPSGPDGLTTTVGRRTFLRVLGGAGSAAAVTACAPAPPERIIPYVVPPDDVVPGVATWYASVCGECPSGCGTLVKTREGRAIKVEGNPAHPTNRGSLCVRGQASLQGLYSPDRYRGPRRRRITHTATGRSVLDPIGWERAQQTLADRLADLRRAGQGDRIAVVTPALTGTLDALVDRWAEALGGARRLRYEAFAYEPLRAAYRAVFGRDGVPQHDFGRADLVVSFGADFLETWLSTVGHARDLAEARRPGNGRSARLVHLEPRLSLTASSADDWIRLEPGAEGAVAAAMVRAIVAEGRVQADALAEADLDSIRALVDAWTPEAAAARSGVPAARIVELARAFSDPDLGSGRTLAVGGGTAVAGAGATETQVAIALLNCVAGNVGATVRFPAATMWDEAATYRDMVDLADAMRGGEIDVLLLHQVNPMHTLPGAADFGAALDAVPLVVATSPHPDETAARADLILPSHTPLEAWGDHRPAGVPGGLMQPAMRPLHDTRHFGDILLDTGRAALAAAPDGAAAESGDAPALPDGDFYELLRDAWRGLQPEPAGAGAADAGAAPAGTPATDPATTDPTAQAAPAPPAGDPATEPATADPTAHAHTTAHADT
ncbi:MAG: molybdopterin-dependent oxidoreductase, partial [Acidobacteria bacterium]|nr:molybdopterin-dependent oxidoreductase [Acidobacteriota bacterium]